MEHISHLIKVWNLINYIISRLYMVLSQFDSFNYYGNIVLLPMLSFRLRVFEKS